LTDEFYSHRQLTRSFQISREYSRTTTIASWFPKKTRLY
jgi:hypothetical protein